MIKTTITINDADLEAGIAQALDAHNATLDSPITQDQFVSDIAAATFEAFRGSAKRALLEKAALLDYADLAVLQPAIEAKAAQIAEDAVSAQVKP